MRPFASRHVLAALLILVLSLAGVGRGFAAVADGALQGPIIAGVVVPICHSGADPAPPSDPGGPLHSLCCDQCALCAPMALSEAPAVPVASPIGHGVERLAVQVLTVRLARARTPRQSQGPPAA